MVLRNGEAEEVCERSAELHARRLVVLAVLRHYSAKDEHDETELLDSGAIGKIEQRIRSRLRWWGADAEEAELFVSLYSGIGRGTGAHVAFPVDDLLHFDCKDANVDVAEIAACEVDLRVRVENYLQSKQPKFRGFAMRQTDVVTSRPNLVPVRRHILKDLRH